METLKLHKFRENCCCCFKNVKNGINVCLCHLSFCDRHFKMHSKKASCSILYRVEEDNELIIKETGLNDEEKYKAVERLQLLLKCSNYDKKVIFKTNEVECPHLLHISVNDKIQIGKLKTLKCFECEIVNNLYICFTCGFIGCGRVQYGTEGNGHALHHFKMTSHSIFVLITSITSDYVCDTFCYKCDEWIINPICESKIQAQEFAKNDVIFNNNEYIIDESVNSQPSPFLGIKNAGNTCFISSAFQLIGFIGSKENIDFESHFEICKENNPLNCIYCQSCKLFNEMKYSKNSMDIKSISIADLLVLIWKFFPFFQKNIQEDASEFLFAFLNVLNEGERDNVFPKFCHLIRFKTENQSSCNFCSTKNIQEEENFALITTFIRSLQECVKDYFSDQTYLCNCKNQRSATTKILTLPKYLLISVKKFKYEDQMCKKILDNLSVDEVNMLEFIKKPSISNYFVEELLTKGFTYGEIFLSLLDSSDLSSKEEIIKEYKKNKRTNPVYNVKGSIIHTGNSFDNGHYMWYAKSEETFFLVNDMKVTEESVEWLEQSYIVCLS